MASSSDVLLIEKNDTLETGFRSKANNNFSQIITGFDFPVPSNGQNFSQGDILRLKKKSGGFIDINLVQYYASQASVSSQIANAVGIPYKGEWLGAYDGVVLVDYQGNLYRSKSATADTDEPGVSSTWIPVTKSLGGAEPQLVSINATGGEQQTLTSSDIPAGYYAAKAYVLNEDGSADWSRIRRQSDGSYLLLTFGQTTQVMFL